MRLHTLDGLEIYGLYQKLDSDENNKYAHELIAEFHEMYDLESSQDSLWFIVSLALKSENERIDGHERSDLLFFFECIRMLLFATAAIAEKQNE